MDGSGLLRARDDGSHHERHLARRRLKGDRLPGPCPEERAAEWRLAADHRDARLHGLRGRGSHDVALDVAVGVHHLHDVARGHDPFGPVARAHVWQVTLQSIETLVEVVVACRLVIGEEGEWWPDAPRAGDPPVERLLTDRGWAVHETGAATEADPGCLLAARVPLEAVRLETPAGLEHRAVAAAVDVGGTRLAVVGVYVPTAGRGDGGKVELLDWLGDVPIELSDFDGLVLAGDFNSDHVDDTGARSRVVAEPAFARLFEQGWRDGYRLLHPPGQAASWWWKRKSRAGGFRLDHLLITGAVRPLTVRYLTRLAAHHLVRVPGTDEKAFSDHAMLLADLETGPPPTLAPSGEPWSLTGRSD